MMVWKMIFLFQGARILRFQPLSSRGVTSCFSCICVVFFLGGREFNLWRDVVGITWVLLTAMSSSAVGLVPNGLLAKLQSWWSKTPPKQLLTPHKQHAQNLGDLASWLTILIFYTILHLQMLTKDPYDLNVPLPFVIINKKLLVSTPSNNYCN